MGAFRSLYSSVSAVVVLDVHAIAHDNMGRAVISQYGGNRDEPSAIQVERRKSGRLLPLSRKKP